MKWAETGSNSTILILPIWTNIGPDYFRGQRILSLEELENTDFPYPPEEWEEEAKHGLES